MVTKVFSKDVIGRNNNFTRNCALTMQRVAPPFWFERIYNLETAANEAVKQGRQCWVLKPFDDDVVICRYAAHACFNIDIYWGKTLKYVR